jgi:adenine phosphoribosyltransferase
MDFKTKIRVIENFPQAGISFKDITTLLQDGKAYKAAIEHIAAFARQVSADVIVGPEARGFVVGAPVAYALELGFVPVRKSGKLPHTTVQTDYSLEYGRDQLAMHADAIKKGQRVLIVDDLLATGGTIQATIRLVEQLGGVIAGLAFLIELVDLNGRDKLKGREIFTLVQYD